jgi:hypothetical protein
VSHDLIDRIGADGVNLFLTSFVEDFETACASDVADDVAGAVLSLTDGLEFVETIFLNNESLAFLPFGDVHLDVTHGRIVRGNGAEKETSPGFPDELACHVAQAARALVVNDLDWRTATHSDASANDFVERPFLAGIAALNGIPIECDRV